MSVYFKLKIDERKDGKIEAITVRNQKINFGLFTFLHQVVHTAIRMYNGDWAWMDYRITFAKSNRGTAHPNEVEIIANTAYPDMDIAQSIITQTIVIYEHKLRALRMSLMAIENTMK